jgi:hypothetical protein
LALKSLLKVTFGGDVSITLVIVSPLWRTMLYNTGYCFWRVTFRSHLSSQNLISDPSLMKKEPMPKKYFFVAMSPAQKCESPSFQRTRDNAFGPIYFRLRIVLGLWVLGALYLHHQMQMEPRRIVGRRGQPHDRWADPKPSPWSYALSSKISGLRFQVLLRRRFNRSAPLLLRSPSWHRGEEGRLDSRLCVLVFF